MLIVPTFWIPGLAWGFLEFHSIAISACLTHSNNMEIFCWVYQDLYYYLEVMKNSPIIFVILTGLRWIIIIYYLMQFQYLKFRPAGSYSGFKITSQNVSK